MASFVLLVAASFALYVSLYFCYHIDKFSPSTTNTHTYDKVSTISLFTAATVCLAQGTVDLDLFIK